MMTQNNNQPYFAEVIESTLQTWRAQSWQWDTFPPFGSLITIESGNRKIFGLVCQIETGSMDPGRYPFPYQKTEAELLREQPQIFEFLRTTFICLTVGYEEHGTITYQLAPQPPKIHAFARAASPEEATGFFADNRYLHLIFNCAQHVTNIDELLLATLKQRKNEISTTTVKELADSFALLTGNDYRRLKLLLQRAQQLIPTGN